MPTWTSSVADIEAISVCGRPAASPHLGVRGAGTFNADGFDSPYPRYAGGQPPKFMLPKRLDIRTIAEFKPTERFDRSWVSVG